MIFFLHPIFLLALACVGIPVLLHFLMRQKPRKIAFPAVRFLQSREKSCRQSLRLKHWLLLALRMLLIVLLVLLFARPSFMAKNLKSTRNNVENNAENNLENSAESGKVAVYSSAPTAAVFLFDTSVRMDYVAENQSSLTRAQQEAGRILMGLPAQSTASVVATHLAPLAFSPDLGEIQRQILQLETSAVARPIPEALMDALALLKTSDLAQKELFIFTDQSAASWELGGASRRQELERLLNSLPGVRITILDTGAENPVNCQLEIPTENAFQTVSGGTVEVHAEIRTPDKLTHRVGIFMLDENGTPQLRGETVTEAEKSVSSLVFQLGGLKNGSNQGFLAILDGDALTADNVRAFTIQKDPPTPILMVAEEPAERNAFFVQQALAPTQYALENRANYECSVISYAQFSRWVGGSSGTQNRLSGGNGSSTSFSSSGTSRLGTLERYHAIFFLDPPDFSASEWSRLSQYVHAGGGIALFLGPSLQNPKSYQIAEAQSFLPATPGFQARFPDGAYFTPIGGSAHPILKTFQSLNMPIPWDESPVFRAWTLTDLAPDAQRLFTWSNGTSALLACRRGSGNILLSGTPIHPTQNDSRNVWNLLPRGDSWVFLVLMNTATEFLTSSETAPENIFTQEPLAIPLRNLRESRFQLEFLPCQIPGEVEKIENSETTRQDTEAVFVPDAERHLLDIPALEKVGNYQISGSESGFRRGFSVNFPLALTDLTRTETEAIRQIFQPTEVTFLQSAEFLERHLSGVQSSGELFNWLGLLILLIFGVENWVANRFYKNV
ncbi:MAG: BatA domain-containing protein [Planctomycetia bacterium]|nr:BatA domain-containing protein [Planctomycetia bacterium]